MFTNLNQALKLEKAMVIPLVDIIFGTELYVDKGRDPLKRIKNLHSDTLSSATYSYVQIIITDLAPMGPKSNATY
jgi:hypothetical protein